MKKQEDIDLHLANYLSGTATEQQIKDIREWAKESQGLAFELEILEKLWRERTADPKTVSHDNVKSRLWASYLQDEPIREKNHTLPFARHWFWKVAAAILILIIPVNYVFFQGETVQEQAPISKQIVKENPTGQKSQIHLPDGSSVWLNAESSIVFDQHLFGSTREVTLFGEAYFDVKRDTLSPFVVHIGDLSVAVLGTEFNVSAYNEDSEITIALVHGSVKVNTIVDRQYCWHKAKEWHFLKKTTIIIRFPYSKTRCTTIG